VEAVSKCLAFSGYKAREDEGGEENGKAPWKNTEPGEE